MKTTIKISSIIALILGSLSLLGGLLDLTTDPESGHAIIGGLLFVGYAVLSLVYISKH